MKQLSRLLSLLLALALAITACAFAESADDTADTDPVLFSYDGREFKKSQVDEALQNLLANGYLNNEYDYDTTIDYMISDLLIDQKITELGLDQYTDEETAAFVAEAQQEWDELMDDYVSYYLTEDSDEARDTLRQNAEALYGSYGYSPEMILNSKLSQDSYERLQNKLFEDAGIAVSEDEVKAAFETYALQDKETYENSIYMYELYKYYGQPIWYQPEGYRGIIHILIRVDDELLSVYQDAQNAYEESLNAEDEGDSEALLAVAEAAKQAVLDSEKAAIDDIYAKLAQGESFESLIALYGEDEGMTDEENLKNGYEVHKDSIMWDAAFTAAAFQDKMQKPGDTSDPVVGANGIHILHYLRDIPSGPVEMTQEIHDELQEYLENVKKNEALTQALESWKAEHEIVMNTEAIEAAKTPAEDAADLPDPDQDAPIPEIGAETDAEEAEEAAPVEEAVPAE